MWILAADRQAGGLGSALVGGIASRSHSTIEATTVQQQLAGLTGEWIDAWHSGGVGCDAVGRPRAIGSGRLFVVSGRGQRSVMGRSRCWYRVGGKRQRWWLSAAVTQSKVKRRALSTHREGSSAGARALTSLPSAG